MPGASKHKVQTRRQLPAGGAAPASAAPRSTLAPTRPHFESPMSSNPIYDFTPTTGSASDADMAHGVAEDTVENIFWDAEIGACCCTKPACVRAVKKRFQEIRARKEAQMAAAEAARAPTFPTSAVTRPVETYASPTLAELVEADRRREMTRRMASAEELALPPKTARRLEMLRRMARDETLAAVKAAADEDAYKDLGTEMDRMTLESAGRRHHHNPPPVGDSPSSSSQHWLYDPFTGAPRYHHAASSPAPAKKPLKSRVYLGL